MISAVVLTKNEEKNIVDCLESLNFTDEVIVVDDNSQDRTIDVAKRLEAKVFIRNLNNNFSDQRNFAITKAKNEWILFLDADERVTPGLKNEIVEFVNNPGDYVAAFIKRKDMLWGHLFEYGETGNRTFIRLAKKSAGHWVRPVHEEWSVNGKTKTFKNYLLHFPHQSVDEFLKEINLYTDIRARELFEAKIKVKWYSILLYPKMKFLQNYFIKLGFLDGIPGFIQAVIMSFHSFLVRGKLWLLWQKKINFLFLILLLVAFPLGEIARISINEIAVTLMDLTIGSIVLFWLFNKKRFPKTKLTKPLLIFIAALGISLLANSPSLEPGEILVSSLYLVRWAFYAFLYFIIADLNLSRQKIEKAMFAGGSLVTALGFIQYFLYPDLRNLYYLGWDEHLYRMFSSFFDPNFAGIFFVLFFLFVLDKLLNKEKSNSLKFILFVTFIALALTFSRSAYVAFIIGLATLSILNKKKLFGLLTIVIFIISIYAASVLVLKSEGTNILRTASGEARLESLNNVVEIIRDYPIFGVGFNSYRYIQKDYGFVDESEMLIHSAAGTDNSFLFVLATSGIVGFLALSYLWLNILLNKNVLVISSTLALFTSSLFVNSLFFPPIMFWMWILIAVKESN